MTVWSDYKVIPEENNVPPPVGAPENMPTSMVNNVLREVMSVIRQLGDQTQVDFDALGTMSLQDADGVLIIGGDITATLAGPGAGVTNLKAQNLIEGPIPSTIFPADATALDVKVARATVADSLTSTLSVLPIGTILMWYSAAAIPAGWALCDGTNGTPNLVSRLPVGAGPGLPLGAMGGQWTVGAVTDAQGSHSHGGGTAAVALTVGQMPAHGHYDQTGFGAGGGAVTGARIQDASAIQQSNQGTTIAGNNEAHAHGIGADGNHAHNVTVTTQPPYTAVYFIMRIS